MWKPLKLLPWLVSLGVAWGVGAAYNVYWGGNNTWIRAMYFNKMAMAAQIQAPRRLLLVGGSGMHYTVNSRLMEQELGFPVLNLGLDGNLGFNVLFPLIVQQVQRGDIVLLVPEYLMLLDEDGLGERSVRFGIAIGQPGLGHIPPKQFAQDAMLLGVPSLRGVVGAIKDLVTEGKIVAYYSDPLTDRGDPTTTWERQGRWWQMTVKEPVSAHSLEMIRQFQRDVQAKGGTLVLSLPVIYGSRDSTTLKNVAKTAEQLKQIAPLLYDPVSLNVSTDSDQFADTHYHLLPAARITRSQDMIRQLRAALPDQMTANSSPPRPSTAASSPSPTSP